jgi:ABC-type nitrate/sulfonate/bicarbonate transport system substrate-binding protein
LKAPSAIGRRNGEPEDNRMIARCLVLAGCLVATLATSAAAEQRVVRMAFPQPEFAPLCVPTWYARVGGAPTSFKDVNISITAIQLAVPQTPVAVHTGDVDVGDCAGLSVIAQAWGKGATDLVIVYAGAVKALYVLIGSKKIAKLADLKGGKLGVPSVQSTAGEAVSEVLKRGAGLLPGRDYTFVSTGTAVARAASLAVGSIDGTSSLAPLSYKLIDDGFPLVADEMNYVPKYVSGILFTTRSWAQKNRDTLVALLKNAVQIGEWLGNPANKDAVLGVLAKTEYLAHTPLGDSYARRFYADMIDAKRIAFGGYADEDTFQANLDIMADQGYLNRATFPPLDKLVDYSYLNEARRELGLPAVKEFGK